MAELFLYIDNFFKNTIDNCALFLICFLIISIIFFIALFLCLFCKSFSNKNRFTFFLFSLTVILFQISIIITGNKNIGYALLNLSICSFYFIIIFSLKNSKKERDNQRSLVRYIDEQIHNNSSLSGQSNEIDLSSKDDLEDDIDFTEKPSIPQRTQEPIYKDKKEKKSDIDFTHVKNVLSRLEYFPLSTLDKKQVKELESAILIAERGENSRENKIKINDCLGALLKIMSKYGV